MCNHKSDQVNIKSHNNFKGNNNTYKKSKKRAPRKITETYLHNSALYYLERFVASKKHFKFVMLRKVKRSCMHHTDQDYDKCAKMVNALADKFEKSGILNDDIYTNGLVKSLRRKCMSRSAIINKMHVKGISKDKTIEALDRLNDDLCETSDEADWKGALKLAKKKRIGPFFMGDEQNIKKSLGILARAGFSYQTAKAILECDDENIESYLF